MNNNVAILTTNPTPKSIIWHTFLVCLLLQIYDKPTLGTTLTIVRDDCQSRLLTNTPSRSSSFDITYILFLKCDTTVGTIVVNVFRTLFTFGTFYLWQVPRRLDSTLL